jgi:signal transduction histidine kinase
LDSAPADNVIPRALTDLAQGFGSRHAVLFQIKSYHTEDYRGQWKACSAADDANCCRENRDWDFLRLIDDDVRATLETGESCLLVIDRLLPDFRQLYAERGVQALVVMPLTVMGQWWGCVCIEQRPNDPSSDLGALGSDLDTLAALFSIYYGRRQAVEGCQERDKLSGALEMAGTVCHKLNQPMQVILGYASMVTSGDIRDPEQIGEIVQLIEDETRQMGIITKNLMGITKQRNFD